MAVVIGEMMNCENCGKEIIKARYNTRFCSRECGREYHNNHRVRSGERTRIKRNVKKKEPDIYCCPRVKECAYSLFLGNVSNSSLRYCGFMEITGKPRGGFASECEHFMPRDRQRKRKRVHVNGRKGY